MHYAPIPGYPELIRQIAFRSMENGIPSAIDEPIITAGCLEALYISLRSTCRRGDTVLIQSPTYYCFLQLLETLGLRAIEIPPIPEAAFHPPIWPTPCPPSTSRPACSLPITTTPIQA